MLRTFPHLCVDERDRAQGLQRWRLRPTRRKDVVAAAILVAAGNRQRSFIFPLETPLPSLQLFRPTANRSGANLLRHNVGLDSLPPKIALDSHVVVESVDYFVLTFQVPFTSPTLTSVLDTPRFGAEPLRRSCTTTASHPPGPEALPILGFVLIVARLHSSSASDGAGGASRMKSPVITALRYESEIQPRLLAISSPMIRSGWPRRNWFAVIEITTNTFRESAAPVSSSLLLAALTVAAPSAPSPSPPSTPETPPPPSTLPLCHTKA